MSEPLLVTLLTIANSAGIVGLVAKAVLDHASARALEEQRKASQAALEFLRTNLTLSAETRRHVASKRVETLMRIGEIINGKSDEHTLLQRTLPDKVPVGDRVAALDDYLGALRRAEVLFDLHSLEKLYAFGTYLQNALPNTDPAVMAQTGVRLMDIWRGAEEARAAALASIRDLLSAHLEALERVK
jgi:hypothetical protein